MMGALEGRKMTLSKKAKGTLWIIVAIDHRNTSYW